MTGRGARPILARAVSCFTEIAGAAPRRAVDLGCGDGTETLSLLQQGWNVLAIDKEPEAIALLERRVRLEHRALLETRITALEELDLPPADLILACFSLPFCRPGAFPAAWKSICDSLTPDGVFAGHLFGDKDSWATSQDMTFHTRDAVQGLFGSFDIIGLREEQEDGQAFSGPKHWHLFYIIARKKA